MLTSQTSPATVGGFGRNAPQRWGRPDFPPSPPVGAGGRHGDGDAVRPSVHPSCVRPTTVLHPPPHAGIPNIQPPELRPIQLIRPSDHPSVRPSSLPLQELWGVHFGKTRSPKQVAIIFPCFVYFLYHVPFTLPPALAKSIFFVIQDPQCA